MKYSLCNTCFNIFSFRYSKRLVSGLLITMLLVMHAKIMLEGCLVIPYLPASPQSTGHTDSTCVDASSPTERVCLANCEYSVNKPKISGEISLLNNVIVLPVVIFVICLFVGLSHRIPCSTSRTSQGPPLYLLFLRLFIPIPYFSQ